MKAYIFTIMLLLGSISTYAEDKLYNVVEFDIVVERELPNDQLSVLLAAEEEGSRPPKLSEMINKDMTWALEKANKRKEVKVQTMSYSVQPMYNKGKIKSWYASQELEISSNKNITGLTELVGELQEHLQVKNMYFTTTPAVRQRHEDELIEEALKAVKQRAAVIQKHMDAKNMRILNLGISTDDNGMSPPMFFRSGMEMADIEETEPAIAMGTSKITISIVATVQFF